MLSLTSALDGGEWLASRPSHFTPRERAPGTPWIGGWVGPRAILDVVVKRKIPSPCQEWNPRTLIIQPVAHCCQVLLPFCAWLELLWTHDLVMGIVCTWYIPNLIHKLLSYFGNSLKYVSSGFLFHLTKVIVYMCHVLSSSFAYIMISMKHKPFLSCEDNLGPLDEIDLDVTLVNVNVQFFM
jgi:hypothetical protein